MRKLLTVMAMVIALVMSTMAMAFADDHVEEGRQGNNVCYGVSGAGGMEFANPGEMFRYIQDTYGMGPAEWIETRQAETVGEFIYNRCVFHNPDA